MIHDFPDIVQIEETQEYAEEAKLKELVSLYSEFIEFPIYLYSSKEELLRQCQGIPVAFTLGLIMAWQHIRGDAGVCRGEFEGHSQLQNGLRVPQWHAASLRVICAPCTWLC